MQPIAEEPGKAAAAVRMRPSCGEMPGRFRPIVDATRCEGRADCVRVCPFDVFEVVKMPDEQFAQMPFLTRMKLWVHGRKTALTPNADACRACGFCVDVCREKAVRLVEQTV